MCERISTRKSVYYLLVDGCDRSRLSRKGDAPFDGYSVCQTLISVSILKCKSQILIKVMIRVIRSMKLLS